MLELLAVSVGLAMDATAAGLGKGTQLRPWRWRPALVVAGLFGFFQGAMPLLGWVLGDQFAEVVADWDHWVAFGLLAVLGGKMLWEAAFGSDDDDARNPFGIWHLLALAVATSIDALAVGVALALLDWDVLSSAVTIACVTFALSLTGVAVGHRFGARYERPAEIVGGIILILIGLRILLSHL